MRLLVIEDESELAGLLRAALTRAGFAVDLVGNIASAQDYLAVATYDAMIFDLGLPDGDGMSLLRAMRGKGNGTPVLILTARDAPGRPRGWSRYRCRRLRDQAVPYDRADLAHARAAAPAERCVGSTTGSLAMLCWTPPCDREA